MLVVSSATKPRCNMCNSKHKRKPELLALHHVAGMWLISSATQDFYCWKTEKYLFGNSYCYFSDSEFCQEADDDDKMVVEKNEQTKQNLKRKKELNNEVQEDWHHCHCHRLKTLQERVANLQNKVKKKKEAWAHEISQEEEGGALWTRRSQFMYVYHFQSIKL